MGKNSIWFLLPMALFGDLVIPFLLAPFYKGYKHSLQVMSVLGNHQSPVHILYNCWLVFLGVIILVGSRAIYLLFAKESKSLAMLMTTIIIVYAIGGCVLSGFFSVGETKDLQNISEIIHAVGSVVGFMLLTLAPLLCGIYFYKIHNNGLAVFCICCLVLAVLFFVLFVMADKIVFQNTIIAYEGLWQRLTLLFMYLPITGICLYAYRKYP